MAVEHSTLVMASPSGFHNGFCHYYCCSKPRVAELLTSSKTMVSFVTQRALVSASYKGYVDMPNTSIKIGMEHSVSGNYFTGPSSQIKL